MYFISSILYDLPTLVLGGDEAVCACKFFTFGTPVPVDALFINSNI